GFRDVTGTSLGRGGSAEFSPDLRFLAALPSEEEGPDVITVLDLADGRAVARIQQRAPILFAPGGRTLATYDLLGAGGLRLWETVGGRERLRVEGSLAGARFTPDGRLLVVFLCESLAARRSDNGFIEVWEVETGRRYWRLPDVCGYNWALSS